MPKCISSYECNFCQEKFENEWECKEHEKLHLEERASITLEQAIEKMRLCIANADYCDEYLLEKNQEIRSQVFGGEFIYGISLVPASFAYNLAIKLLEATKNPGMIIHYEKEE